jgi:hypothetical protein
VGVLQVRHVREVEAMSRRVRPQAVRRRLLALLETRRAMPEWMAAESADWQAGYVAGVRAARDLIRKG